MGPTRHVSRYRAFRGYWMLTSLLLFVLSHCMNSLPADAAPPRAGGLQALPEQRIEPWPLANSGFEEEKTGWKFGSSKTFVIVQSNARSGNACLRFDASAPSRYTPSVRQPLPDIQPGVYRLRFWLRTQDIVPPERGSGGLRVSVEYALDTGQRARAATKIYTGTTNWQMVELSAFLPKDLKRESVSVSVHRYGAPRGGEAWLDDFILEQVRPPAVEAFLCYPNYRGFLAEDGPQRVRIWVKANENVPNESPQIAVVDAAGKEVARVSTDIGRLPGVVELNADNWALGEYGVQVSLGAYKPPPYVIQKTSADQRRQLAVWFDTNNVLEMREKPTFPIGLYVTSDYSETPQSYIDGHLQKMSEAPVNFVINYWQGAAPTAACRAYFEAQRRFGINYLVTVNNFYPGRYGKGTALLNELLPEAKGELTTQEQADRFTAAYAEAVRTEPNFAGWYVMDERPFDQVPRHFHQYQVLREADPDHVTLAVSNKSRELASWRDTVDVLGMDPYPLINMKLGRPLTLVAEETRASVEATHGSRPVWMVIQFFQGWSVDRWPTEEELRIMSLMAVTEGARGLFYWSFGARGLAWVKDPNEKEKYWQGLVNVTKELKSLEPALLAPDAPEVVKNVSDARIRWRAREADGKWYVFAYLPAKKFSERAEAPAVDVVFTFKNGRQVTKSFRPDTADWFELGRQE